MSNDAHLDRRTVLKATSSSVLLGGIGTVSGSRFDEYGTINLVESGIRYSFPSQPSYDYYHVDTPTDYWVDSNRGQLILRKRASQSTYSLFQSSRRVVNAQQLAANTASVTRADESSRLPTEFASRYRTSEYVLLDRPITEPSAGVEYDGTKPIVRTGGAERRLPEGEEVTVSLDPITVTAKTRSVSNQKADLPNVPDRKLGYKVERGTTKVTVQPEVVATNYGELDVAEMVK